MRRREPLGDLAAARYYPPDAIGRKSVAVPAQKRPRVCQKRPLSSMRLPCAARGVVGPARSDSRQVLRLIAQHANRNAKRDLEYGQRALEYTCSQRQLRGTGARRVARAHTPLPFVSAAAAAAVAAAVAAAGLFGHTLGLFWHQSCGCAAASRAAGCVLRRWRGCGGLLLECV